MKKTLLLISVILFSTLGFNQKHRDDSRYDKIDTLRKSGDSIFARIRTFQNDSLIMVGTAFLIPDSIRVPKFQITGNLIKTTVYIERIIWDGRKTEYFKNGQSRICEYQKGKVISSTYFDRNQNEILASEFNTNIRGHDFKGEFYIKGKKKKK